MNKVRLWWNGLSEKGLRLPFVWDARTDKPSITLLFSYLTFTIMLISLILLHIWPSLILATGTSILAWVISVVFYRLRNLDKFKMDLDDQFFELEGDNDEDG